MNNLSTVAENPVTPKTIMAGIKNDDGNSTPDGIVLLKSGITSDYCAESSRY
jgi:hypothetical protein